METKMTYADWEQYEEMINYLNDLFGKGNVMAIKTAGGIHLLFRKEKVKLNPEFICNHIRNILPRAKEIVRNTNEMIPLPGTRQYEQYLVTVLNKEDFGPEHRLH